MITKAGEEWPYIEAILGHADRVLLYGPPGVGKTFISNRYGKPDRVFNITLTEETPMAELRGHYVPKGGEWLWQHGPAINAWLLGTRLVINEIGNASGDCLDFLMALLDDRDIASIDLPNGERVFPHDGFQAIATTNIDPADLPEALYDRFPVKFHVQAPHPDAIKSLPKDLQKIAESTSKSSNPKEQVGIRSWHTYAHLREETNEETAAIAVFGVRAKNMLDALRIAGGQVSSGSKVGKAKTST